MFLKMGCSTSRSLVGTKEHVRPMSLVTNNTGNDSTSTSQLLRSLSSSMKSVSGTRLPERSTGIPHKKMHMLQIIFRVIPSLCSRKTESKGIGRISHKKSRKLANATENRHRSASYSPCQEEHANTTIVEAVQ